MSQLGSQESLRTEYDSIRQITDESFQACKKRTEHHGKKLMLEVVMEQKRMDCTIKEIEKVEDGYGNGQKQIEEKLSLRGTDGHHSHSSVAQVGIETTVVQDVVSRLESHLTWLRHKFPGLAKAQSAEQSSLMDMAAIHAVECNQMKDIIAAQKLEQDRWEKLVARLKDDRNNLGVVSAIFGLEWNQANMVNKNQRETLRLAYEIALKEMEWALTEAQRQMKEQKLQEGTCPDAAMFVNLPRIILSTIL